MTGLPLWGIQNPAYQESAFLLEVTMAAAMTAYIHIKYGIGMANIELPNFMDYKDKFSNSAFVDKIQRVAKRAGVKLVYMALILYYTLESNQVSVKDKALIVGALGYLITPIDVIPDAIPIAGLGDDLGVLAWVLKKVWGDVSEDVKQKAKDKLSAWFDDDELSGVGRLFAEDPTDAPV